MSHYRAVGRIPKKRHTQMRQDNGELFAEELMGEEGFTSDASLLYHRYPPTALTASVGVDCGADVHGFTDNHPLSPRHFRTHELTPGGDLVTGRRPLLGNEDVRLSYVAASSPSELYRNARGDEVVYVESGRALLETVYGPLDVGPGDYVVVPGSTTHRWVPQGAQPVRALVIEARGHIRPPRRYLSDYGQFLEHAPYCERDLRAPDQLLAVEDESVDVLVRHRGGMSRLTYLHHPFDVVGWDGCLYPYAFNIADFEPIVGRVHMPPPVHQTFEGPNFVICSFCPRPFDFDPKAIAVPYNHANVDSDEVLFYVGGDFMSRRNAGIAVGSISLHPAGWVHGPQPGAVEASLGAARTDEWAVMVDTFRPLGLDLESGGAEADDYPWTWAPGARS
jgi:homogentisate 1,2-dioxygenase